MKSLGRRQALQYGGSALLCAWMSNSERSSARGGIANRAKIKIGQIGVGHGHANKLSVYRASSDYEVIGVVEPKESLRAAAVKTDAFRDVQWMSQAELLDTPGLQAVLVETSVRDLLTTAEACIDRGLHVHLDKPAGASMSHYERILMKAEQKKLLVQMGYMYRYNPAVLLLQECLKKGWIGDVFEVHTVMSKVVDSTARRELAEFSGGIMFELGCHIIDLVVGVLGKPNRIESFQQQAQRDTDSLADNMLSVLEYSGAIATVKSAAVEVDGFERRHFVVCGTKGTFHIQPLDNPVARVTFDTVRAPFQKGYQDITFPKFSRYIADAADMAKIIQGEKESDFSYNHDRIVQSTVLRACGMSVT